MKSNQLPSIGLAILAALLYAINIPCSKLLLQQIGPVSLAAFLYLGAGLGIGAVYLLGNHRRRADLHPLTKSEFPFVLAMIVLDILAPIFLMIGLSTANAAAASLLNNFEIVATALVALLVFREVISPYLWSAIALITISSALLSGQDFSHISLDIGSIFVLLACVCWGFENNCTRKLSSKNTYEIVILKGIFSGLGSLITAFIVGESLPSLVPLLLAMALGFVAYGLSIFCYIKAQNTLGAAKTSAFYALAPFLASGISFVALQEPFTATFPLALGVMAIGTLFAVVDSFAQSHNHTHRHHNFSFVHYRLVMTVTEHQHDHTPFHHHHE